MTPSRTSPKKRASSPQRSRSAAEWVTFAIALLIVGIVVGLILFRWTTASSAPPLLRITTTSEIRQTRQQFYVPFSVTNTGGKTAESVQVLGELRIGERVQEEGEQQIDFLSPGETETGAFIFSQNPDDGTLTLRVGSYILP